jgi:hypothetical protein
VNKAQASCCTRKKYQLKQLVLRQLVTSKLRKDSGMGC